MPLEDIQCRSGFHRPEANRLVQAATRQELPIVAKDDWSRTVARRAKGIVQLPVGGLPETNIAMRRRRDKHVLVSTKHDREHIQSQWKATTAQIGFAEVNVGYGHPAKIGLPDAKPGEVVARDIDLQMQQQVEEITARVARRQRRGSVQRSQDRLSLR